MLYVPLAFGVQFEAYQCDKPLTTRTLRARYILVMRCFRLLYLEISYANDNLFFFLTYYRLKLSSVKKILTYRFILNFHCLQAQPHGRWSETAQVIKVI